MAGMRDGDRWWRMVILIACSLMIIAILLLVGGRIQLAAGVVPVQLSATMLYLVGSVRVWL